MWVFDCVIIFNTIRVYTPYENLDPQAKLGRFFKTVMMLIICTVHSPTVYSTPTLIESSKNSPNPSDDGFHQEARTSTVGSNSDCSSCFSSSSAISNFLRHHTLIHFKSSTQAVPATLMVAMANHWLAGNDTNFK